MWIPPAVSYLVAALAVVALWMRDADRRAARWQARGTNERHPSAADGRTLRLRG